MSQKIRSKKIRLLIFFANIFHAVTETNLNQNSDIIFFKNNNFLTCFYVIFL